MILKFIKASDLGARHCSAIIAADTVVVDLSLVSVQCYVTETNFRGITAMEIVPVIEGWLAVDLPEGTWDLYDMVTEIAGQRYKLTPNAYEADAGSARQIMLSLNREFHYRYVRRLPTLTPEAALPFTVAGKSAMKPAPLPPPPPRRLPVPPPQPKRGRRW